MIGFSKDALQIAMGAALLVLIGVKTLAPAAAQDGWVTLFDGKNLDQWNQVGGSNWHIAEEAVIADQMADKKEPGYLVSKKSYKNFIVRVEFWPKLMTPTAASTSAASIRRRSPIAPATKPTSSTSALTPATAPAESRAMSRSIPCRRPGKSGIPTRLRSKDETLR